MSHGEDVKVRQDGSFSPSFSPRMDTARAAHQLDPAEDKVLAKIARLGANGDKFKVEALFSVKGQTVGRDNVVRIRLSRLWGGVPLESGALLGKCEYDPDTFEVERGTVSLAYEVVDSHHINDVSYGVKVRTVDPRTLGVEAGSSASTTGLGDLQRRVSLFQGLLRNLAPGHKVLMRMKSGHDREAVEPEQVVVVQSTSVIPASAGYGPLPEKGSVWGLVGGVSSDGQLETSAEYKVLSSNSSSLKNHWEARFEKVSTNRKLFSLTDCRKTS